MTEFKKIELDDGKYVIKQHRQHETHDEYGRYIEPYEFLRHGESWQAANAGLIGNNLMHAILDRLFETDPANWTLTTALEDDDAADGEDLLRKAYAEMNKNLQEMFNTTAELRGERIDGDVLDGLKEMLNGMLIIAAQLADARIKRLRVVQLLSHVDETQSGQDVALKVLGILA